MNTLVKMEIRSPVTDEEFNQYYDLRWKVLREPWQQPKGSEKDELEDQAVHMAAIEDGKVIGVGRAHFNSSEEAQIRFMAVNPGYQKKGIGKKIYDALEIEAKKKGAKSIIANARKSATDFYLKNGFKIDGDSHTLFGSVPHFKIKKIL